MLLTKESNIYLIVIPIKQINFINNKKAGVQYQTFYHAYNSICMFFLYTFYTEDYHEAFSWNISNTDT